MSTVPVLKQQTEVYVRQRHELAEWIGFETRNKYEFMDQQQRPLAFAAEQGKGILSFLAKQVLGHWRSFELHFFTSDRQPYLRAVHPFRFYFEELQVYDHRGQEIGRVVKKFSIFSKSFEILSQRGESVMTMKSPFWKIWTFPIRKHGRDVAAIQKNWSGLLAEMMTDKDNFQLSFKDPSLSENERCLLLAAALFVDLQYFEKKGDNSSFF